MKLQIRAALGLATAVLLLLQGAGAQAAAALDARSYIHPNRLVAVDGPRRLNLFCLGRGAPTVILISGGAVAAWGWRRVQGELAGFTRVCAYDRAGLGHSDPATRESDLDNAVDDMSRLIAAARIDTPVVLVGHSFGGLIASTYASRHSGQVAGLVLVDPYVVGQWRRAGAVMSERVRTGTRRANAHAEAASAACLALAAQGAITRAKNPECLDDLDPPDALLQAEMDRQESSLDHYWRAARSEWRNALPGDDPDLTSRDDRQAAGDRLAFGAKPLVVLGAGHEEVLHDPAAEAALAQVRRDELQALAARSTAGRYVFVANAGHDIPDDNSAAVVDAVRQVAQAARAADPAMAAQPSAVETFADYTSGTRVALRAWQAHDWRAALAEFDADHDGRITEAEHLAARCRDTSDPRCPYGARLEFLARDRNHDGVVDRDEMDAVSANLFRMNDRNRDGYVTREEMARTAAGR